MGVRIAPMTVAMGIAMVSAARLAAQSGTGSALAGNVADKTAIPNAQVKTAELNTGAVRAVQSNADGRFPFSQANPGTYRIEVDATGFGVGRSQPVSVAVGQTASVNFVLSPASAPFDCAIAMRFASLRMTFFLAVGRNKSAEALTCVGACGSFFNPVRLARTHALPFWRGGWVSQARSHSTQSTRGMGTDLWCGKEDGRLRRCPHLRIEIWGTRQGFVVREGRRSAAPMPTSQNRDMGHPASCRRG